MERPGHGTVRKILIGLSVLTVLAAAFVLAGILFGKTGPSWPWFAGAPSASPASAKVTYVERFTRCGDTTSTVEDVPRERVAAVVAALAPEWKVVQSEDASVEVRKDTYDYCALHRDCRLIALYRNAPTEPLHVCVFRGNKIDPAYLLREVKNLTEDDLYPRERAELRNGVLVPDPQDTTPGDVDEKVATCLQGIAEGR